MAKQSNNVRQRREKLKLSQEKFWSPIGITQSGGSRYERKRRLPTIIQHMVDIVHGSDAVAARTVKQLRGAQAE